MILEKVPCSCACKTTVFAPDGIRCADEKSCGHIVKIELTDVSWNEPDLYLDKRSHRPVVVKDVQPSSRHDE